ncbi:histidine kinase [Algoriphagus namhaensis]
MNEYFSYLIEFLENSNRNGLALMTIAILFYLAVFHCILYIKNQEKYFLYYSIYAFVNAVALIGRPYKSYLKDLYFTYPEFFRLTITPLQFISFIVFSYFLIEILRLKTYYPRFIQFYISYTKGISIVFGIFFLGTFLWDGYALMRQFYFFVFMPITFVFLVIGIYLVAKTKEKVTKPILFGFLVIGIASFLVGFLTAEKDVEFGNKLFYIFYLGLLIENIFFTYALAIKQRTAFLEKIDVQKKLLRELQENASLRIALNEELSTQLAKKRKNILSLSEQVESERMERVKASYEQEINKLHLQSFHSQMNPLFIFNALNSVKVCLISGDKDRAIFYLNRFSKLIRLVLESSRKNQITLGEELEIAKLYLDLESIRFEDGIDFQLTLEDDLRLNELAVPPLILQPFFENAIWHGLMHQAGPKWIKVRLSKEKEYLKLSIRDNGIGRKESARINSAKTIKKESIGLKMVKDRLELFSQNESVRYFFEIVDHTSEDRDSHGTEVICYFGK